MNHNIKKKDNFISLLPMSAEDSEEYRKIRNDDKNRLSFFNTSPITKMQQSRWYQSYLLNETDFMFSIYIYGRFIGGCGLYNIDMNGRTAEFGRIVITDKYRGKGVGTETVILIKKIAKEDLKLCQLFLEVREDNLIAYRVYSKAGFKQTENKGTIVRMMCSLK